MDKAHSYKALERCEKLHQKFAASLKQPELNPLVFNIWGIGGVGKTSFLRELKNKYEREAQFLEVSFGTTISAETPIDIMLTMHEQISKFSGGISGFLQRKGEFETLYTQYQNAIQKLETQPIDGSNVVSTENIALLKRLLYPVVFTAGQFLPSFAQSQQSAEKVADLLVDTGVMLATEKDRLQQLLQKHKATRKRAELQKLLLQPLLRLTQAFSRDLIRKSQKLPIVVLLDTYEERSSEVDQWLWRYLLANTDLRNYKIRLVIAGRFCILEQENWQRLHRSLIFAQPLNCLTQQQTKEYLYQKTKNLKPGYIEDIYQATQGLPYYLEWIAWQKEIGQEIDFLKGKEQIQNIILRSISSSRKDLLELLACCHWFDGNIFKYLLDNFDDLEIEPINKPQIDILNQVVREHCVEQFGFRYRINPIARSVFQNSLWRNNNQQFQSVHVLLASYFKNLLVSHFAEETPLHILYEDSEWRGYVVEFGYHSLLSNNRSCQESFQAHLSIFRFSSFYNLLSNLLCPVIHEIKSSDFFPSLHETQRFLSVLESETGFYSIQLPEKEVRNTPTFKTKNSATRLKSLQDEIDALQENTILAISPAKNEYVGSVEITRPIILDGNEATVLAERGPIISIKSENVTLRNLRVEVTAKRSNSLVDNCAIFIEDVQGFHIENVEVRGCIMGLPDEEGEWNYPESLQLGRLAPNKECQVILKVFVPTACEIISQVSGIDCHPRKLMPGINEVSLQMEAFPEDTLLSGNLFLVTKSFKRRIAIAGISRLSKDGESTLQSNSVIWQPENWEELLNDNTLANQSSEQTTIVAADFSSIPSTLKETDSSQNTINQTIQPSSVLPGKKSGAIRRSDPGKNSLFQQLSSESSEEPDNSVIEVGEQPGVPINSIFLPKPPEEPDKQVLEVGEQPGVPINPIFRDFNQSESEALAGELPETEASNSRPSSSSNQVLKNRLFSPDFVSNNTNEEEKQAEGTSPEQPDRRLISSVFDRFENNEADSTSNNANVQDDKPNPLKGTIFEFNPDKDDDLT